MERLRTGEGETLSGPDLHILEVQLYLLGREVIRMKDLIPGNTILHNPTSFSSVRIWPGQKIAALSNQCQAVMDRTPRTSLRYF